MAWQQFVIDTATDEIEELEQALLDCGALAVSLEDAGDAPVLEPAPGETPLWPRTRVKALFDAATAFQRGAPRHDDMTAVAVKIVGKGEVKSA